MFWQEVLEQKTGAVQNSPTDKAAPEPSPWSPVCLSEIQKYGMKFLQTYVERLPYCFSQSVYALHVDVVNEDASLVLFAQDHFLPLLVTKVKLSRLIDEEPFLVMVLQVKRKAQDVGPFDCTKYSKNVRTSD